MKTRIAILLILLMVVTLSCNAISNLGKPDSAVEGTAPAGVASQATVAVATIENEIQTDGQATATPVGQSGEQPGGESILGSGQTGPQTLDLADPALYTHPSTSYIFKVHITYTGATTSGETQTVELTVEEQAQAEPEQASRMHMESKEPSENQTLTITTIGGQDYIESDDGTCMVFPHSESSGDDFSTEEISKVLLGQAELVEKGVQVGEVMTDRYALTQENIVKHSFDLAEDDELQSASLYRARDSGALVRLEMIVSGKVSEYGYDPEKPVTIQMVIEQLFMKPGGLTIQAPQECDGFEIEEEEGEASGGEQVAEDIPLPPEDTISNRFSMQGVLTFNTTLEFQDAISFYKTEMPANGWALEQEYITDFSAYLSYKQGERTAEVTITPPGDNNPVLVVIITSP